MNDTPKTIDEYLRALRRAFGAAPPGLVADALADAEEHLRNSLAAHPGQSEAEAIQELWRSAADVAAEYPPRKSVPRDLCAAAENFSPRVCIGPIPAFFGVVKDPVTYGALFYMLLAGATGILFFTWAVTGIAQSRDWRS